MYITHGHTQEKERGAVRPQLSVCTLQTWKVLGVDRLSNGERSDRGKEIPFLTYKLNIGFADLLLDDGRAERPVGVQLVGLSTVEDP